MKTSLIAAAFWALLAANPIAAQESYELRLAGFVSPVHGMSKWLDGWAASLEEQSEGRLSFEILHGAQMGPPPRYYDFARNGQADITWVLHGATPGRFPLTEISNMPFLFCSAEQATRVLNNLELRERFLDPEHLGVKVLMQFSAPPGHAFMADDAVLSVDDFSGKAIRPASRAIGMMITELGGVPVGLPPTGIAEALQKGTLDGAFTDYSGAAFAFQLAPFLESVTEVSLYATSFSLVMNPEAFDGLPPDLQELITASITDIDGEIGNVWDGLDAAGKNALADAGVPIQAMPDAELAEMRRIGEELLAAYVSDLDGQGKPASETLALMQRLAAEVGQVGFGCQP